MEGIKATCSNPGCDRPGTNKCGACDSTPYCGPTCQKEDWPHHKEECPGNTLLLTPLTPALLRLLLLLFYLFLLLLLLFLFINFYCYFL